jgi:hypothetical protein
MTPQEAEKLGVTEMAKQAISRNAPPREEGTQSNSTDVSRRSPTTNGLLRYLKQHGLGVGQWNDCAKSVRPFNLDFFDIECSHAGPAVVTELALPDRTGFQLLDDLVPFIPKQQVAVVVLTKFMHKGVQELAKNPERVPLA